MCAKCEQNKGVKLTSKDFTNKGGSFKKTCDDDMYLHNIAVNIPFTQYLKVWLKNFTQDDNGVWNPPRYIPANHDLHKFVQIPEPMFQPSTSVMFQETNLSSALHQVVYENDNVGFDITQFA